MFGFVVGIIIIIVAIGMGLTKSLKEAKAAKFIAPVGAIVGIVFIASSFIHTVPTGSTGIVTTFGRVEDYTLDAGMSVLAPWKKVICMDNRTQKATIPMSCFSSDIQEVTLTYTINYQIDKENAQTIYKTIGTDYFNVVVQPKAYEAVKGVFALYNAESLVASRATLSQEIETILSKSLQQYNIQIVSTSLEDIDFTDAFTNAVEAKQVAEQNKLRAQTEQEQQNIEAEAQATRRKVAAQAEADAAIIAAQADAEIAKIAADSAEYQGQKDAAIMSNLGNMLQKYPELINYYYATGWDGKLPTTMLSDDGNLMFNVK